MGVYVDKYEREKIIATHSSPQNDSELDAAYGRVIEAELELRISESRTMLLERKLQSAIKEASRVQKVLFEKEMAALRSTSETGAISFALEEARGVK
jgi:hypothetical protein